MIEMTKYEVRMTNENAGAAGEMTNQKIQVSSDE